MTGHCDRWHVWVTRSVYLTWPYAQPLTIQYRVCERCGTVVSR